MSITLSRILFILLLSAIFLSLWQAAAADPRLDERRHATSTPTTRPRLTSCLQDISAPMIDRLFIGPTVIHAGEPVTFTVSAHDDCGINTVIFDIHYPATTYVLHPNCNFDGRVRDMCSLTETIDHGFSPPRLGEYTISVRIVDVKGNVARYHADGTLEGGNSPTHSIFIPSILVQ